MAAGLLDGGVQARLVVDLRDAEGGAGAGRLHEQRPAVLAGEVDDPAAGRERVLLPLAGADHLVGADGQPEGGEDPLHVLLVLADGRGEHARADVGDAGELQQALEGAVLAVRAVQHGEDDVDLAEGLGHRAGLGVDDLPAGGVGGEDDGAVPGLRDVVDARQRPAGDGHPLGGVGGQRPAAVGGDADGQHVVLRPVDGAQDGAGRDDGDGVLGAASAEDDGHTRLAPGGGGEVLAAHIAMSVPCSYVARQRPASAPLRLGAARHQLLEGHHRGLPLVDDADDRLGDRHVDAVPVREVEDGLAGLDALGGLPGDRDGLLEGHALAEVETEGVVPGQRRGAGGHQVPRGRRGRRR